MEACDTCNGWGMLRKNGSRLPIAVFVYKDVIPNVIICPNCQGTGEIDE